MSATLLKPRRKRRWPRPNETDFYGGYLLAAEPTATLRGTPGRIAEYRRRARAGVSLFHPGDFNLGAVPKSSR